MRYILLSVLLGTLLHLTSTAQCELGRFVNPIFEVQRDTALLFGSALQGPDDALEEMDLYLDLYQPEGDTMSQRPMIILAFGGSFIVGNRDDYYMIDLCNHFASLGYVTASIDYRVTGELLSTPSEETAYRAVAKGTHDMRAAVRYFHKEAQNLNIDPTQIYVGGVSAGAFAAVHAAYLDKESEVPEVLEEYFANWGGLAGNSGNEGYSMDVAGVINLSGAIGLPEWIEEGDLPIVSMHGTADDVVPYGHGLITLFDINAQVYGSSIIHERAEEVGIHHDFYTWEGEGHTPFVNVPPLFVNEDAPIHFQTVIDFVGTFMADLVCNQSNVSNQNLAPQALIYPNPTQGAILIDIPTTEALSYSITDLTGAIVQQGVCELRQIDLDPDHSPGMYLLTIYGIEQSYGTSRIVLH